MKLKKHEAELMSNISVRIREIADMMEELRPGGGFRELIENDTPSDSKPTERIETQGIPLNEFWEKDDGESMEGMIRIERFIRSRGTDSAQIWSAWYDIKQILKAIQHEFIDGMDFVCPSDTDHHPAKWKKCKKCGFVEEPYTKKCDPTSYRSSMASYSCSTQSNSTQKLTAEERAQQLFHGKGKDVPKLAMEYIKYLSNKYGGCSEVFLTGAAHYAQAIEGLICTDDLYKINEEGKDWFEKNK